MSDNPWYEDGLRFKCTQCGDCCTGSPGYVWVNKQEIQQLAVEMDMEVEAFEKKYVRTIGIRKSLVEYANGDCVFFDNKSRKCNVYQSRPRQCRTWPFWDSNIRTPEAWQTTCEACPGSGKGTFVSLELIKERASVIKILSILATARILGGRRVPLHVCSGSNNADLVVWLMFVDYVDDKDYRRALSIRRHEQLQLTLVVRFK